jgi:hypothetical protein
VGSALIEKSPAHVHWPGAMHRMHKYCPDAFYLHLVRHPVPMWASLTKLREEISELVADSQSGQTGQWTPRYRNLNPDKSWLRPNLAILEFLEDIPVDKQMRLRGEDLLSDPPNYLAQICQWLGKRDDAEAIVAMLHPETSPFATYGPSKARFGNDPSFLKNPELRPFTHKEYSFDEPDPDGGTVAFSNDVRAYAQLFGY